MNRSKCPDLGNRIGFKVVTPDMQSLGLRRNPNIMTFKKGEWVVLPDDQIEKGVGDWGGIWVKTTRSGARKLKKYMTEEAKIRASDCRIFVTKIGKVLYENPWRIKTDRVFLEEEID